MADLEGVEDMFQGTMKFCFVVVEVNDVERFFGRWAVALVFSGLVLDDECEGYFDSFIKVDKDYAYVDVVVDVQGFACVVIWWEDGDETMSVEKICFVLREDRWGGLCP